MVTRKNIKKNKKPSVRKCGLIVSSLALDMLLKKTVCKLHEVISLT